MDTARRESVRSRNSSVRGASQSKASFFLSGWPAPRAAIRLAEQLFPALPVSNTACAIRYARIQASQPSTSSARLPRSVEHARMPVLMDRGVCSKVEALGAGCLTAISARLQMTSSYTSILTAAELQEHLTARQKSTTCSELEVPSILICSRADTDASTPCFSHRWGNCEHCVADLDEDVGETEVARRKLHAQRLARRNTS